MVYRKYMKRILDSVIALSGLVLFLPLWLGIAIAICVDSPGGPLFKQTRVGLGGRHFAMYKFRSMVPNAASLGKGLYFDGENDWRITRVGRHLRRLSLDEIPQLVNILKGDMSLVGPRPMLPVQFQRLTPVQQQRCRVRPGVTGLAQVSGRNGLPWSERIRLDLKYVEGISLWLDADILLKTVVVAMTSRGISYDLTPELVEDFGEKEAVDSEHRRP